MKTFLEFIKFGIILICSFAIAIVVLLLLALVRAVF